MNGNLQIGVSQIDITPAEYKKMLRAGGLYPVRIKTIKDPLFAKAIVIASEDFKIAIITLDLIHISLSKELIELKKTIERTTGIKSNNILICPSHTHTGPYTDVTRITDPTYENERLLHLDYLDKVYKAINEAVNKASNDLEWCKVGIAKGKIEGISHNRRVLKEKDDCWNTWLLPREERDKYPATGPIDTDLYVLAAATKGDRIKAILYNYALHACNSRTAESISGDYPAYVQQEVAKKLDEQVITLFLPGACGNVNGNHFSEVIGKRIGEEILEKIKTINFDIKPILSSKNIEIELPIRRIPRDRDTHFQEEEIKRKWPRGLEYYNNQYKILKRQKQLTVKANLTGIRISDDIALITNPAELFTEFGLEIKKASPFKYTIVIELTNGAIGYVPTKEAFRQGGYETFYASSSRLDPEAGDIIVKESLNILQNLKHTYNPV
jgi:neutral ceramidase